MIYVVIFLSFFLQTGWTIAVDVVIGPKDGISYRAERGSLVSAYQLSVPKPKPK